MKKVLIALFIVLAAFVTIACKQPEPEPVDPGHVHEMTAVGAIYKCSGCGNFYEDEAGTKKLATIGSLDQLRQLCQIGGKGVLTADIDGVDLQTSAVYSDQRAVLNVYADTTLYDDGTARTLRRTTASNAAKDQFIEICGGASLRLIASAAGKIVIDGNDTTVSGNGYMLRVNSQYTDYSGATPVAKTGYPSSAELVNVLIKKGKNEGTGSTIRLDHAKGADVALTMTNCTVQGCSTTGNGGVMTDTGDTNKAVVMLTGCTFSGNSCNNYGSVIYITGCNSELVFANCTFTGNTTNGNSAPFCVNKDKNAFLTLVGTNTVNTTQYAAAKKVEYTDTVRVYWPAAT